MSRPLRVKSRVEAPSANGDHSESVVLYLEKPIVAVKRFGHQLDDLKRRLSRREHVD